uniref:Uncharacterized protein n=1 Tax=Romanomermis culicivorax TaxID=13658 RepID=A0A915HFE7_ROMCU
MSPGEQKEVNANDEQPGFHRLIWKRIDYRKPFSRGVGKITEIVNSYEGNISESSKFSIQIFMNIRQIFETTE